MENMEINKSTNKYICQKCNFSTLKKNHYERHLQTNKHKNNENAPNGNNLGHVKNNIIYSCKKCEKIYKTNSGLWKHEKKCGYIKKDYNNNDDFKSLIIKIMTDNSDKMNLLIKENEELRYQLKLQNEQINDLIPKVGNNNTTQNNKFNIHVFLNEKCKDAINMTDFIKSLQVSIQQLDFTKCNGLANGLSKTIMDNMNKLSLYERPVHCTDVKRETLYIKDEDVWAKDANKEKIKKAIKKASGKNYNALQDWKTENPDFLVNDSKTDYFTNTIRIIGKTDNSTEEKIIKNLCKETYIKDSI